MKYFETVLKQAKKEKRYNCQSEIGYKNYRCVTDGHRIHGIATNHDYGLKTISLTSDPYTPPDLGMFLDEIPKSTHLLHLDAKQSKTVIAISKIGEYKATPMILEITGDHVVLSYDNKDGINWNLDFNSHPDQGNIRIPINGAYLADLLKASTVWELSQAKEGAPVYFKSSDKIAVIMPMREL